MRLGAALPLGDLGGGPAGPRSFAESARILEDLGYSSLWTFDAVGRGFFLPDSLMALSVAAQVTERIELATGIMQLPIRNVAEVVHRLFTLEQLAPGRLVFGVGPGSTAADFDAFCGDFGSRFETFDEQWAELRRWVANGVDGERDLSIPPALHGSPTLMLAGWRGAMVERSARESAGWVASAAHGDAEQLSEAIGRYRAAGGQRAVVTNIQPGEDLAPTIEQLHRFAEMGFDDAVVFDLAATRERVAEVREAVPDE